MPKGHTLNVNWHEIRATLDSLEHGGKGDYIDALAATLGVSTDKVRREMKKVFGPRRAVVREATRATDVVVRAVAQVKEAYRLGTLKGTGRTLSTHAALDIAVERGLIPADARPSASAVNTAIERLGYNVADPRVRVEAAYACQQFQIDFSRSKHFQVVRRLDSGDWLLRTSAKELHYKDGAAKLRTWVVQMVDEYSRLRLVQYYAATGEGVLLGLQFLQWAFTRAEDDHLLRHVPERLKSDQGAFLKTQETRAALDALGIDVRLTTPGNSESQGKVERGFRTLWTSFEAPLFTRLRLEMGDKAEVTLSELNRLVHAFAIAEQASDHPTQQGTRGTLYQRSILRQPPRTLDADLLDLAVRTWERTADATAVVQIGSARFQAPPYAASKTLRVFRSLAGDFVAELIDGYHAGKPFPLQPFSAFDLDVFEHRPHRSHAMEARATAEDLLERAGRTVKPLVPKAQPIAPASPVLEAHAAAAAQRHLSRLEALAEIGARLRAHDIAPDALDLTGLAPPEGMPAAEIGALTDRLLGFGRSLRLAS